MSRGNYPWYYEVFVEVVVDDKPATQGTDP